MKVATLGPAGTHSELALKEFNAGAVPVFCSSIAEVFRRVAEEKVEAGFVPIENVIQGPVSETLDELLTHRGVLYAAAAHVLPIRNAVGIAEGPWPRKVEHVFSHEQALRQSASTLERLFPGALLTPYPSTTAAIHVLLNDRRQDVAVVAPAGGLRERGINVIHENVSDNPDNKTRFVLLQRGDVNKQIEESSFGPPFVTAIVIDPGRDRKGLLFEIIQILSVHHKINLNSIHSRPDNRGGFVFHLNLEGHPKEPNLLAGLRALDDYCHQATGATAEVTTVGFYENKPFFSLPFDSVGIVGGQGRMGQWFTEFFESVGIRVAYSDLESGMSLEELCRDSKVILLSVPMSAAGELARKVCSLLTPGQLVVENCSIKNCALQVLENEAAEGVEVLGIHTMFGEKTASFRAENVVVTRTAKSGPIALSFENLLYKHGAHLHQCAADEHDQVTAVIQSLLQLSLVIVGDVASRALPRRDVLRAFSTPNFRLFEQALLRVINQTGALTNDLQTLNPKAARVRNQLLESACRLIFSLEQNDASELTAVVERLKLFFADKASR